MSPFLWRQNTAPSIFATPEELRKAQRSADSRQGAHKHIAQHIAATGRNPGTLTGISKKKGRA